MAGGRRGSAKVAFINHLLGALRGKCREAAFVMMSVNPRSSLLID